MPVELKERAAAKAAGDVYYQGSICRRGHDGKRYTANSNCADCEVLRNNGTIGALPDYAPAREAARLAGHTTFNGVPCKRGHDGKRFVSNSSCVQCNPDPDVEKRSDAEKRGVVYDIDLVAETRQEAIRDGIGYYHGKTCEKCGGDIRVYPSSGCLNCYSPLAAKGYKRRHYESRKHLIRDRNLRRDYGITSEDYAAMLFSQEGRCAICKCLPLENKVLHVDHDHETGKVRKLLCHGCNTSLGGFQDDPANLLRGFNYLIEHGKPDPRCHVKPVYHRLESHDGTHSSRKDPGCQEATVH